MYLLPESKLKIPTGSYISNSGILTTTIVSMSSVLPLLNTLMYSSKSSVTKPSFNTTGCLTSTLGCLTFVSSISTLTTFESDKPSGVEAVTVTEKTPSLSNQVAHTNLPGDSCLNLESLIEYVIGSLSISVAIAKITAVCPSFTFILLIGFNTGPWFTLSTSILTTFESDKPSGVEAVTVTEKTPSLSNQVAHANLPGDSCLNLESLIEYVIGSLSISVAIAKITAVCPSFTFILLIGFSTGPWFILLTVIVIVLVSTPPLPSLAVNVTW